jgi:hypothetical protein
MTLAGEGSGVRFFDVTFSKKEIADEKVIDFQIIDNQIVNSIFNPMIY